MIVIGFVLSASPPGLIFWTGLESAGDLVKMQICQIQVGKCKGKALTFCIFNNLMVLMLLICQPHLGSKNIDRWSFSSLKSRAEFNFDLSSPFFFCETFFF